MNKDYSKPFLEPPIKVVHVLGHLVRGGAETMVMNLYRNLDRSKFQFDFVVHNNKKFDYDDEILSLGGKIYRIKPYKLYNHFSYKRQWRKLFLENRDWKIIHGHVRSTAAIYLAMAKKYGIKTISHSHSTSNGKGISAIVKRILQYPIRFIAEHFIGCSLESGKWLFGKKIINSSKYSILHSAIDLEQFSYNHEVREKNKIEFGLSNEFVVGHVGRFTPEKNHKFILNVFKEILDIIPNSKLLLVGTGAIFENIKDLVSQMHLSNSVIMFGNRSDVNQLMQIMDVMLFPSLWEGLPLVLIEAQTAGLPCVISDNISKEVCICEEVTMLPLSLSPKTWAENVTSFYNYERKNNYDIISKTDYNIVSSEKTLIDIYNSLLKI